MASKNAKTRFISVYASDYILLRLISDEYDLKPQDLIADLLQMHLDNYMINECGATAEEIKELIRKEK